MANDVPESVGDLGPHSGAVVPRGARIDRRVCRGGLRDDRRAGRRRWCDVVRRRRCCRGACDRGLILATTAANGGDQARRSEEAHRVDEDRDRRREDRDDPAGERLAEDLRGGCADLELRVSLDEILSLQDRRQVRLVGDVEEDRHDPVDEADDVELPDRQDVKRIGDRDRDEHQPAPEIADHEDPLPREAIDPDARRQREQQERQELDRHQQPDLARRGVQQHRRDERDRDLAHLRPEQGHGGGRPEACEVGLPEKAASARRGRGGHSGTTHDAVGGRDSR